MRWQVLFAFLGLAVSSAIAQDVAGLEQGIKPYGSYHGGDIDSVSMVNGSLSVHIPLISYPQRGGKLHFGVSIVYSTPSLSARGTVRCQFGGGSVCYPSHMQYYSSSNPYGDLRVMPDFVPTIAANYLNSKIAPCDSQPCPTPTPTFYDYSVINYDHANHHLGQTGTNNWVSRDATGYGLNTAYISTGMMILTDRNGIQYKVPQIANGNPYGPATCCGTVSEIEDSNGNKITLTGVSQTSNGNWTDTMGRQIPNWYVTPNSFSVPGPNGGTNTFTINRTTITSSFPNLTPCAGPSSVFCGNSGYSSTEVQNVELPNGTAWGFAYDSVTGALSQINLPTGGTISYTWTTSTQCTGQPAYSDYPTYALVVATRTVNANDGTGPHTWTYTYNTGSGNYPATYTTVVTDPQGNDTVHTMASLGNDVCTDVYEKQVDKYQGRYANGNLLESTATSYSYAADPYQLANASGYSYSGEYSGEVMGVVPSTITHTEAGRTSQVTKSYDSGIRISVGTAGSGYATYGNVIQEKDYDYGSTNGSHGGLLRTVNTSYMALSGPNAASYLTMNLLTVPYTVQILDGSGSQVSLTQYNYDESTPTPSGLGSQYQHASPSTAYVGNNTSIYQWLSSGTLNCPNGGTGGSNGYIVGTKTYFDDGMLNASIDPCHHSTTYGYSMAYWGALATSVTNAANQTTTNAYDFNTSLIASTTDPNNLTTSFNYDNMWRLDQVSRPDGGQQIITHEETTFPFTSTLTSSINGSLNKVETNVFDGLGRVSEHRLISDPQGTVYTDTTYDALGRVYTSSNPYRGGSDASSSPGLTTYSYDALGRKTSESYPDGSVLRTAYCGPSTLVTDPTGRWRRSQVDALGRLIEVDEPNVVGATVNSNGCRGTSEPIWVTSYTNDALGNLKQIVQNGSHARTFTYDSLSRLLTSSNPENGTITYNYNPDSTVLSKTDGRSITTYYSYEPLHRVTAISYSNGDPSVSYAYDESGCLGLTGCQNIGQRTGMADASGSESWAYKVDRSNLRNIHVEQRTTLGVTKRTTYYMDLAGEMTQLVYPTGRVVNYAYDGSGRPSTATDGNNGITYATGWQTPPSGTSCTSSATCYTPQGTVYGISIGQTSSFSGLNIFESFNSRMQPNEIRASSTAGTAMDITYSFVDPVSGHNANHVNQIANNLNSNRTQTFTYDQVNRILTAGTAATSGTNCWGYQYTYDAWGNLNAQQGLANYPSCSEFLGSAIANGNNHLASFSYDASGNTLSDGNYAYGWNGASEMVTAGGMTYSYDGNGRRAAKVGNKLYWYGSGDQILAETDTSGNVLNEYVFFGGRRVAQVPASGSALYYVEDMLRSSRVIVQSAGTLCYDADFTPFGAESAFTSSCSKSYKFEGKERDAETGNDDFGAREYSWRFGRWLSSDWSAVPVPVPYANLTNPQTLNLYAMVADDPESFADLDGHTGEGDPNAIQSKILDDMHNGMSANDALAKENSAQQQGEAQGGGPQGQNSQGTLRPGGPTLVAMALENPKTAVLGTWRGRDVDYGVFELNKDGTIGYRNRNVTVGLQEKLLSGDNVKRGICDHSNCSEQGTFEDRQSVQKGHDFSVQRSWTANGVSIQVWNPNTSQPAKYEVLHLQYGSEFTMEYGK